jgi:hypothetical protein
MLIGWKWSSPTTKSMLDWLDRCIADRKVTRLKSVETSRTNKATWVWLGWLVDDWTWWRGVFSSRSRAGIDELWNTLSPATTREDGDPGPIPRRPRGYTHPEGIWRVPKSTLLRGDCHDEPWMVGVVHAPRSMVNEAPNFHVAVFEDLPKTRYSVSTPPRQKYS